MREKSGEVTKGEGRLYVFYNKPSKFNNSSIDLHFYNIIWTNRSLKHTLLLVKKRHKEENAGVKSEMPCLKLAKALFISYEDWKECL